MADFLKAAKQQAIEVIEVAGVKIEVRGLSFGEITKISKGKESDAEGLTKDLIVACCFDEKGKPLIPDDRKLELNDISPAAFKALSDAVMRVNGFQAGN